MRQIRALTQTKQKKKINDLRNKALSCLFLNLEIKNKKNLFLYFFI